MSFRSSWSQCRQVVDFGTLKHVAIAASSFLSIRFSIFTKALHVIVFVSLWHCIVRLIWEKEIKHEIQFMYVWYVLCHLGCIVTLKFNTARRTCTIICHVMFKRKLKVYKYEENMYFCLKCYLRCNCMSWFILIFTLLQKFLSKILC